MTNPLFSRHFSITSLYNSLNGMPEQDPLSFFQLSPLGCTGIVDKTDPDCNVAWYETQSQVSGQGINPTRGLWSRYLAENERKIADYLGYWPGPKLIENEVIRVENWTRYLRTKYIKVVRAGSRKLTKLSEGLPKSFNITNSPFSPFQDLYNVTVGDLANPLQPAPNCNYWLYPNNYELKDEWALRPLSVTGLQDGALSLCAPLWVAVRPELYYTWPNEQGRVRRLCICDDIYINDFHLYQESWELPHGYVRLAKEYCSTCNGNDSANCDACNLPSIPICLEPRDWERGIFSFKPIINTGTEVNPCWEQRDSLEDCCNFLANQGVKPINARFMYQCYCTQPLDVEISYVSSCDGSWYDECITNDTCHDLLRPVVDMSLTSLNNCNCGCLNERLSTLQQDMVLFTDRSRTQNITQDMLIFGTRRGHVEAYQYLTNFCKKKKPISYI